jgi:hypothetical protein
LQLFCLLAAIAVCLTAGCHRPLVYGRGTPQEYQLEYWKELPDTISQAKKEGIDYVRTVDRALGRDLEALRALFRLEGIGGAGGEGHSSVLAALLDTLGDKFFAEVVAGEKPDVKNEVARTLDYELCPGEESLDDVLARKYPATWAALFTVEERVRFLVKSCRREVHGHQRDWEVADLGPAAVPVLLGMLNDERKVWVRIGPPQGGPESRHIDVKYLYADDEGPRNSVAEFALLCICHIRSPKTEYDEVFRAIYDPFIHEFTDYDGKVSQETQDLVRRWYAESVR